MHSHASSTLIQTLLNLPVFHSEWVLWLLLGLSAFSVTIILERYLFYRRHKVDVEKLMSTLMPCLYRGDIAAAARAAASYDGLEAAVLLKGLNAYDKGPESVEEILTAALGWERTRYETNLNFLATLASNAPYIGLFGTVLGIVRSFKEMSANLSDASAGVMAGIAEALIATAVGLLVAIPAVLAYNSLKNVVKKRLVDAEVLGRLLLSELKSAAPASDIRAAE